MKTRFVAATAALLFSSTMVAPAAAETVFTSGPISPSASFGYTINGEFSPFSVSASFVLDRATTVTGFTFGGWTAPGVFIKSVGYNISATSTGAVVASTDLMKGAATSNDYGYDVREYTGSTASTVLGAGTYWLTLGSADAGTSGAYWEANSNAVSKTNQYLAGNYFAARSGVTFSILGSAAAVPEPASWMMMILGFGVVGYAMRRRQWSSAKVRLA